MNLKMVAVIVGVVVVLVFIFVVASTCCSDAAGSHKFVTSPGDGWAQPGDEIRPTYVNPEYAGSPASMESGGGGGSAYAYPQSPIAIAATPNYARPLNTPGSLQGGNNPYSMSDDALFLDGTTSTKL